MGDETQLKKQGSIAATTLARHGARRLATVVQRDYYYAPLDAASSDDHLLRVRIESGTRTPETKRFISQSSVEERHKAALPESVAYDRKLLKAYSLKSVVEKRRTIYLISRNGHPVSINIDVVRGLGSFVELQTPGLGHQAMLMQLAEDLELGGGGAEKRSYYRLNQDKTRARNPSLNALIIGIEFAFDRIRQVVHPITSGIAAAAALIFSLLGAGVHQSAIVAGVIAVAVAESLAEATGAYFAERADPFREESRPPWRAFVGTFFSRAAIVAALAVPFVVFSTELALLCALSIGLLVLAALGIDSASGLSAKRPHTTGFWSSMARDAALIGLIALLAYIVGRIAAALGH